MKIEREKIQLITKCGICMPSEKKNFPLRQPGDAQRHAHFVARYKVNGRARRLCEHSRFIAGAFIAGCMDGQVDEAH